MSFQSQTFSSLKGLLFSFSIFFSSHCEWLRGLFFLLSAFIWSFRSLFHQVKMFPQYSWIQQQPRSGCRVLFWYCSSCWAPCSNREYNHSLEINGLELWGVPWWVLLLLLLFFVGGTNNAGSVLVLHTYAWRKKKKKKNPQHSEHDRIVLIIALVH